MIQKVRLFWVGFTFLVGLFVVEIILAASFAQSPPAPDPGKGGPGAAKPPLSSGETMLKALNVREVREEIKLSEEQEKNFV